MNIVAEISQPCCSSVIKWGNSKGTRSVVHGNL